MPSEAFVARLTEQVGNELAASAQYAQVALHYDAETLPRLAAFFYAQALEERNHAMMMARYLLDAGVTPALPPTPAPVADFADVVAPVQLALEQERRVTEQINGLAALARQDGDYTSEQFLQWFLKEQVEEVATMSDLLTVVRRSRENPLLAEEYLAREGLGAGDADP
ncbi:MAG: ferritin, partial [Actinomycetota bacterium]|nr:ferritin [Actinomycetota bacterium]